MSLTRSLMANNLMARLGRTVAKPIADSPFLLTNQWHAHKGELAHAITDLDVWKRLTKAYYGADGLRVRVMHEGPGAPLPESRIRDLQEGAVEALQLSEIVYDGAVMIDARLNSPSPRSRWLQAIAAPVRQLRLGTRRQPDEGTASSSPCSDDPRES
jgi:hypothetical protein